MCQSYIQAGVRSNFNSLASSVKETLHLMMYHSRNTALLTNLTHIWGSCRMSGAAQDLDCTVLRARLPWETWGQATPRAEEQVPPRSHRLTDGRVITVQLGFI